MKSIMKILLSLGATGLWFFVSEPGCLAGEQSGDITIDTILKSWKARQERVRSGKFDWIEKKTFTKGSVSRQREFMRKALRKSDPQQDSVVPPEDVTVDIPKTLCFDHNKIRYSYEGKDWSAKNELITTPYVSVFDGTTAVIYDGPGGHTSYPRGVILREKRNLDAGIVQNRAIIMMFRALDPNASPYNARNLRILKQRVRLNDRTCVLVEEKGVAPNQTNLLWIDSERDCTITRFTTEIDGKLEFKLDVHYIHDRTHGWMPNGWHLVTVEIGDPVPRSSNSTIVNYTINSPLDAEGFQIIFPPGTLVSDQRTTPSTDYLVKAHGEKRKIPPEDYPATYDQIVSSAPGQALQVSQSRPRHWAWFLGLGSVLLLGLVVIVRKWKRIRSG